MRKIFFCLSMLAALAADPIKILEGKPLKLQWDYFNPPEANVFRLYFRVAPFPKAELLPPMPPMMATIPAPIAVDTNAPGAIIWATFTTNSFTLTNTNYAAIVPSDLPQGTNLLYLVAVASDIESDPSNTLAVRVLKKDGPSASIPGVISISFWEGHPVIEWKAGPVMTADGVEGPFKKAPQVGPSYLIAEPGASGIWTNPK